MKKIVLASAMVFGFAFSALADGHLAQIAEINEALATQENVSESTKVQVRTLIDEAQGLYDNGDHDGATALLDKARALIGM